MAPAVQQKFRQACLLAALMLCPGAYLTGLPAHTGAQPVSPVLSQPQRASSQRVASASVERQVRRWVTRTERLSMRIWDAAQGIVVVLAWLVGSSAIFAVLAGVAGTLDEHLLRGLRAQWAESSRLLVRGVQVFWKSAFDRALPLAPRVVLLLTWAYWLSPWDLLGENWGWTGVIDDGLMMVGGSRLFSYLCPLEVFERHASGSPLA